MDILPPDRPFFPRGGARNFRERTSDQLDEKQCRDLLTAAEQAYGHGQPFNRWMTAHWQKGGIDARDCCTATGGFIKRARQWMQRRGYRLSWVWVQEYGDGYGAHSHMLLHVPPELGPLFSPKPLRWVKDILPGAYIKGVIETERIRGAESAYAVPELYWMNLYAKLHYMMKAAPPELEARLDMTGRGHTPWGRYCTVHGKRAAQAQWLRKPG